MPIPTSNKPAFKFRNWHSFKNVKNKTNVVYQWAIENSIKDIVFSSTTVYIKERNDALLFKLTWG